MNANRIVTDDWSNPASQALFENRWPNDQHTRMLYEEMGDRCDKCHMFAPLNAVWGLCCHYASDHHLETVRMEFTCGQNELSSGIGHSFVPLDALCDSVEDAATLSETERHYLAVREFLGETFMPASSAKTVRRISRYLVERTGDRWRLTVEGLRMIGATDSADAVQKAAEIFGPDGPAEDYETRHEQYKTLPGAKKKELYRLEFEAPEPLWQLLSDFVATHRDAFSELQP